MRKERVRLKGRDNVDQDRISPALSKSSMNSLTSKGARDYGVQTRSSRSDSIAKNEMASFTMPRIIPGWTREVISLPASMKKLAESCSGTIDLLRLTTSAKNSTTVSHQNIGLQ